LRPILSELKSDRIEDVVSVHLKAFPGFFLSFLGKRFLSEFYKSFMEDSQGIGFVAQGDNEEILGVVVGALNPEGYFKRLLKRRWWEFGVASVNAILRKPSSIPRLVRAMFYRGDAPTGQKRALLSSIAVTPDAQGKGIGKLLVSRWVEEAVYRGSKGCYLTTDAENNELVKSFYESLGWKMGGSYVTPGGRRMNRYVFDL
jgi:GNAT superfamily N-acetyltransferase